MGWCLWFLPQKAFVRTVTVRYCVYGPYMDRGELDTRLELRVSSDLLARVDVARGVIPRGAWVRREMERGLARQVLPEPSTDAAGAALAAMPSFPPAGQEVWSGVVRGSSLVEESREPFYDDGETPDG